MKIQDITQGLEQWAPPMLQESYDNAGLITGHPHQTCTGILVALDATPEVIDEAAQRGCNLVVAHHPIVFGGLKRINGKNYVEQAVIRAIKQDIAIYAIHTNLDNVLDGVNGRMADRLGLVNRRVLQPKRGMLYQLAVFVPHAQVEQVKQALFAAGAGHVGAYSECSFGVEGMGTFRGDASTNPFVGTVGVRHTEPETRVEVIFPAWLEKTVLRAMKAAHPYEEVAYSVYALQNEHQGLGSGLVGELPEPISEEDFIRLVKERFGLQALRHTPLRAKLVKTVALCGGAGSFLTKTAIGSGADWYLTGDVKYHEFFDADGRIVLADIGHYESEQFTIDLLVERLHEKFPTFAVLKTGVNTNPVRYA